MIGVRLLGHKLDIIDKIGIFGIGIGYWLHYNTLVTQYNNLQNVNWLELGRIMTLFVTDTNVSVLAMMVCTFMVIGTIKDGKKCVGN